MESFESQEPRDRRDPPVPAPVSESSRLPSTELREPVPEFEESVDLRDYIEVILRRKWLVATFLMVVFVTTLIVSLTMTPIFKGEARLEVSPQEANVTKFEDLVANQLQTREFMQTQVSLLQSQSLAQRVIDRLQLQNHPAFNPEITSDEDGVLTTWKKTVRGWLSFGEDEPPDETLKRLKTEKAVLGRFSESLSVQPERDTTIINIAFSSEDPQVARDAANTLVQEFVSWQMDKKLNAATSAKEQLEKQLEVARIQLEKAEEELNAFAKKAGIVSLDTRLNLVYRQLEEVNSALAGAESERVARESLYRQAMTAGPDSLPAVIDNEVIQELRTQYIDYLGQYEELKTVYKDEYPKVKIIVARMTDIQQKIEGEQQRIVDSLKNAYLAALKQEEALRSAAEEKKAEAMALNEKATQYNILAREVETNKQIFQSLLERTKEIDANVGSEISNIQVVDYAVLPLEPYKPNVQLNLLLALVLGVMGGVGLAFLLEYLDNTVKRIDEISDRFKIPVLGVIPEAEARETPQLDFLVREQPRSSFSESIRTTKVSIQLSSGCERPLKSLVITSTNVGEGKTTLATNLAIAFASEEKVLILDADLRRPRLHKVFSRNGKDKGLSQFLTGMCDVKQIIQKTDIPNLFFIPSGPISPNPAELLASSRMRKLLESLNTYFDRIIIDAPPFAGFADVLVLGNHADGVILLSTLGVTHREALRIFRKSLLNVKGNLLGTIVNKMDVSHHHGYYYKYYKYYHYGYRYGDEHRALPKSE
ncbi:GumC family protein [Desulfoglaeba alkanexedens]|uniref:non-specific protein-tyrosine kinase n=1 Tax=Desulfoglaeba alkanexedens ALDC TaxID=980445 RepID=A0A4P8KZM2_9BACT|nr:polysaccharide biosynthesis tyrosine autokinase [Desulfoglaeba alkanexedens]QCQ20860.1 polysaccharide biosynthesis tyrosine autokinase [Desulfoglaeba alkanexedens ALDC]